MNSNNQTLESGHQFRFGAISASRYHEYFHGRDLVVGTSFVCLALGSRMGRIPEWPPQDSNSRPSLKVLEEALLVPSVLAPKDMDGPAILSGTPQGKANDVSASPIQGRANDAGRA